MKREFWKRLCAIVGNEHVFTDEPMRKHTTFRIGGMADYYVMPHCSSEIAEVIRVCREFGEPFYVLGNGSNLLVGDKGYRGVILQIFKNYSDITVEGREMKVQAGALLSKVAKTALEHGLSGFEFAAGIPGTVGGAVVMNAGAYGGEMKDVLKEAVVLTREGEILTLTGSELDLGYRTSVIAKKEYIVLEARIGLREGHIKDISGRMEELKEQRVAKQPLEYPSAGSTFKRPTGCFAGKLIMDAGLRGFSVGGAMVSKKHCGFVINKGDATAEDVRCLINEVIKRVEEKFEVTLEPEVKLLGEF